MVRIELLSELGEDGWAEVDDAAWTFSDPFVGLRVAEALESAGPQMLGAQPDPDLHLARLVISFPAVKALGARIVEHAPTDPGPRTGVEF